MSAAVVIAGGGPAGMALALALHRQGIAAEIRDARPRGAAATDPRILALSHGSRQILEWLGVWPELPATAITDIHVSHQGGLGRTRILAAELGVPALGHVLAAGALAAALDRALAAAGISFRGETPLAARADAPLTVWAEGAAAGEALRTRDYRQHAVICTASAAEPPAGRAWERFTPEGPVAALPLGRDYALVMACAAADAPAICALADTDFLALLQRRFGGRVRFTAAGARQAFPLALRYRDSPVGERQVWIGNAAQTLHPVAGQGFNLALRDIHALARELTDATDPGDPKRLAAYAARRRVDRTAVIGFTDGLLRLFGSANPLVSHARGLGLLALDLLPPARHFLARRMMFGARGW